jgi:putative oxidoreductase
MENLILWKTDIAVLLARVILGLLFFMQGYDKIFGIGLKKTEAGMEEAMQPTHLPVGLVRFVTIISSWIELGCGLLLVVGWLIYPALMMLGLNLLMVCFGMSLRQPLWDMRYVWPRLALLLLLLLLPESWDRISVDHILHTYGNAPAITAG